MSKVLFVVGPTASGKTDMALYLADKFSGILINADSVQVYKELDIVSGKDLPQTSEFLKIKTDGNLDLGIYFFGNIQIYLLDVVPPSYEFNVSDFKKIANSLIEKLSSKNLPIVVGGTGFYIKALTQTIDTISIPRDEKLRDKLLKFSVLKLQNLLRKNDIEKFMSLNESDIKNSRRLIRAIEVAFWKAKNNTVFDKKKRSFDTLFIGLKAGRDFIEKRIEKRVDMRMKTGALDEAKSLFKKYNKLSSQVKNASGYKQLFEYLKGEYSLEDSIIRWKTSEISIVKKQMTFFSKNKEIKWFDIEDKNYKKDAKKEVKRWLSV